MNNTEKLYAERDIENLDTYSDHVFHMTSENLRSKSDIAAELAYRDQQIAELTKEIDDAIELIETFSGMPDSGDDLNLLIDNVLTVLKSKEGN